LPADRAAALIAEPVFTAFPAALGESRVASDAPEPMRVAMPPDDVSGSGPRPSWAPAAGETLVYVTFGTQSGTTDRERAMYRTALDAVAGLPVRVLLTTGPNMAEHPLGPVPSNVVVEEFVPQAQVFRHARVVVTHGGSGTVLGALAAGLPLVVAPMFADQPHNARAAAATGAGVAVFDADVPRLRSGIERVLGDEEFSRAARIVATEMANMAGLDLAIVRMVESVIEPAPR
jgi:MGT family glycosyltransferase